MDAAPNAESDAVLVVGIGRFDQRALAEVFRRHGGPVHRLATRLLQDDRLAEEVVQEVFLALWNDPARFDAQRGSLRSFLLMKAHGRAVDVLRAEQARRAREDRDAQYVADGGYDLEHEVWDLAVAERVKDAMHELAPAEREAVRLAYFGGHTYREVAQLLGEPEGTVKSRIRSGLRNLRRSLADVAAEHGLTAGAR